MERLDMVIPQARGLFDAPAMERFDEHLRAELFRRDARLEAIFVVSIPPRAATFGEA
jgi:hypothetical protein